LIHSDITSPMRQKPLPQAGMPPNTEWYLKNFHSIIEQKHNLSCIAAVSLY